MQSPAAESAEVGGFGISPWEIGHDLSEIGIVHDLNIRNGDSTIKTVVFKH